MYSEDSLFTLSTFGRVGVLCISAVLTLLVMYLAWRLMAGRKWYMRLAIALVLFYLFVWLAPQVYYTFYIGYFDFLPWQIVVWEPPTPHNIFALLSFTDRANLSYHSQGALGWGLILLAVFRPRFTR